MYKILKKEKLNDNVTMMEIESELIAKKAKPGQFIILRVDEDGERIPLTIAMTDKSRNAVTIIFQIVGSTTKLLDSKNENEYIQDFVGPLGNPTDIENKKNVVVVGGGVGSAIALPIARALHAQGSKVTSIIGFRSKDILILEDEFKKCSDNLIVTTDDGSYGEKANVTVPLKRLLSQDNTIDEVITIGPLIMMKFVTLTCKEFNVPCTVSMNPIMIDGTGMCGGCRLTLNVDDKKVVKFACVDGPDFNGYEVDFDEAISRNRMYVDFERQAYENTCNLLNKEVK